MEFEEEVELDFFPTINPEEGGMEEFFFLFFSDIFREGLESEINIGEEVSEDVRREGIMESSKFKAAWVDDEDDDDINGIVLKLLFLVILLLLFLFKLGHSGWCIPTRIVEDEEDIRSQQVISVSWGFFFKLLLLDESEFSNKVVEFKSGEMEEQTEEEDDDEKEHKEEVDEEESEEESEEQE